MKMRASGWKFMAPLVVAAMLALPGFAAPTLPASTGMRAPAQVGTINYVEGQATLNGQPISQSAVGTMMTAGQTLATQNGKAELLLTPGVVLRLDSGSALQLDSSDLANTVVSLVQGRAIIEADDVLQANNIVINENGYPIRIVKKGLYEFDATAGQALVFDGQADLQNGKKTVEIHGGHQALLAQAKIKVKGFDKKAYEQSDFYRWASLRSSYLAEANATTAREYMNGGPGWYGPGWYWSPWYDAYTWIPGDGIFWDPFGWGFFSPWFVGYAPFYGYGFGGYGFYGYHHFGPGYHPGFVAGRGFVGSRNFAGARGFGGGPAMAGRGGFVGGGFHGGFAGGGFHGGFAGGGFHGGGFGGGRR